MDKKEKIWFSGVWTILPSSVIALLLIYISTYFQKLIKGGKGKFPMFTGKNVLFFIIFVLVAWLVVFLINVVHYYKGEKEFNPLTRKERVGTTTEDKRKAMQNDRKVAKYLSKEPGGFIIGQRNGK